VLAAEREKVGTLPHIPGVNWIGCASARRRAVGDYVQILPILQVRGFIEQDGSALPFWMPEPTAISHAVFVECRFAPGCGIAEAGDLDSFGRRGNDRRGALGPGAEFWVGGGGVELGFAKLLWPSRRVA
jgi:hypothetical protein